jgi:hypothetical protein
MMLNTIMDTSIANSVFGGLSAIFLTGSVIAVRNVIKINRFNDAWEKGSMDNTIALMPPMPEIQNNLTLLPAKPTLLLHIPEHKMKLLN